MVHLVYHILIEQIHFYHIGLMTTIALFLTREIIEVLALDISTGLNASLSGIAGIGHTSLALGLLTILFILYKATKSNVTKEGE